MTSTPPLAELPRAHILASAFPAATAFAAQGISRPSSPSPVSGASTPALLSRSPSFSRSPSPTRGRLESSASSVIQLDASYPPTPSGDLSRSSSWGHGSRSGSRSKDALFKRSAGEPRDKSTSLLRWLRAIRPEPEEERGRQGRAMARASGGEGSAATRWMSRERAQMVIAFCMIGLVGMNDSATGANLSSMQAHYHVSYDRISIVFLSNVAGYFISCVSSAVLTQHLGLQWSLVVAAAFMAAGCLVLAVVPPFGVFVFALALLGFGGGLYDAALTTVISHEEDGVLMSCMYACFGVGAMVSPLIIGSFIDHGYAWNYYYYLPLGVCLLLGAIAFPVFSTYTPPSDELHPALPSAVGTDTPASGEVVGGRAVISVRTRMRQALGMRAVWIGFVLIVISFGTSDTLSAWMVSFMIEKRKSPEAASRYQLSGLWGGIALGRVTLAYFCRRLGERTFAILMLGLASACLGVVWGVKSVPVDAVALVLVGFFIGPVTPKILSTVSARVPPSLKSATMSLTIGLGLIGSSAGPLAFGVVAGRGGLATLPAVLIGASAISAAAWLLVPRNDRRED